MSNNPKPWMVRLESEPRKHWKTVPAGLLPKNGHYTVGPVELASERHETIEAAIRRGVQMIGRGQGAFAYVGRDGTSPRGGACLIMIYRSAGQVWVRPQDESASMHYADYSIHAAAAKAR